MIVLFCAGIAMPALSQLFTYGVQIGGNYSHYSLSEKNSMIQVTKGSVGFHSGLFVRYDFDNFFLGADLNYTSTLGGTITDNNSDFNIRSGSVNMPGMFGKKFYPGIRLFAGGIPTVYIKRNHNELQSFLENSPYTDPAANGVLDRNEFVFFILAGAGIEFSKFLVEFRYEHPLDFFFREDFSTGGVITNVDNYHYCSQIVMTLGYRFN